VLDWNWREFDTLIERAYRLAPENPDTCQIYASWHLRRKGRYADGIAVLDSILLRDPLCANWRSFQAMLAYYARDFAGAHWFAKLALDIDPSQLLSQWVMTAVRLLNGDTEGALAAGADAVRLSDGNDWVTSTLALALAETGRREEAAAIRDRLRQASRIRYVYPLALVNAAISCGDTEAALDEMDRAADERSPAVFWLMDDPALDPVRRHPRFSALLARIGLPERF
jgi:hypothetical protein